MKQCWIVIMCGILIVLEGLVLACYFSIFNGPISHDVDDWSLFYQLVNGFIIVVLTVINIFVFYKISLSLDVKGKLFETQSVITQMRVRQYENIRALIKNIQTQIIRGKINPEAEDELKKSLMEMDNSFLYKNDNIQDPIFFKSLIEEICNNFENKADKEKLYESLSNFIRVFEFYIVQQLVRDGDLARYIETHKGSIDSTLVCFHQLAKETVNEMNKGKK